MEKLRSCRGEQHSGICAERAVAHCASMSRVTCAAMVAAAAASAALSHENPCSCAPAAGWRAAELIAAHGTAPQAPVAAPQRRSCVLIFPPVVRRPSTTVASLGEGPGHSSHFDGNHVLLGGA